MNRLIVCSLLIGFLLQGCQPEDSVLFFSNLPYPGEPIKAKQEIRLELVRQYGDRDEGLVFGRISALAVQNQSQLAVYDAISCEIWLIEIPTGDWRRIGGCGDGPGEFRFVSAMAFSADTLLVFDKDRASIVKLSPDGEELGRFSPPLAQLGAGSISDLSVGEDGSIFASLVLMHAGVATTHEQLAILDRFGGGVNRTGLLAPPIAQKTPRPIVRSVSACVGRSRDLRDVVVALNPWGPQLAILQRGDLKPIQSLRIPVEWAQSQEHPLREGYWGPFLPLPRLVCGSSFALAAFRDQNGDPAVVSAAAIVVLDFQGNLLKVLETASTPEEGSILYMSPGAAGGDRFFFFSNSFFGYPLVREYRVVEEEP
jgi:hypothetical protein